MSTPSRSESVEDYSVCVGQITYEVKGGGEKCRCVLS